MKKLFFFLVVIIMLLPALVLSESDEKIRVASLTGNVGLAMVQMMDYPQISEVTVGFEVYKSPEPILGKLVTGEIDIAGLPTNAGAILYNKGADVQLAAIIGWGVMYVVGSDASVKRWRDLKGKEVYVASKGAVSDILFRYLVTRNGLDPARDLKIQYLANAAEIAQLTAAGRVSLAAIPEPWVTETLLKNPQIKIVLDYQKEWQRVEKHGSTYPQTCIVIRRKYAREHPELIHQFLNELKQSIGWANRNPKEAGILAEKYVQIPAGTAATGMKRCNLKYQDAYKAKDEVNKFLQRLTEYAPEATGGKLPDDGFFYQP